MANFVLDKLFLQYFSLGTKQEQAEQPNQEQNIKLLISDREFTYLAYRKFASVLFLYL